jgi:hypothetical protein
MGDVVDMSFHVGDEKEEATQEWKSRLVSKGPEEIVKLQSKVDSYYNRFYNTLRARDKALKSHAEKTGSEFLATKTV